MSILRSGRRVWLWAVAAAVFAMPAGAQGPMPPPPPPLPQPPAIAGVPPATPTDMAPEADPEGAITEAPQPAAAAVEAEPSDVSPIPLALTNVVTRDPFWPVGYAPRTAAPIQVTPESIAAPTPAVVVAPPAPEFVVDWPTLKVRGVTRDTSGRQIALVQGVGLVEEGNMVHISSRGVMYNWRVTRISGTGVEFERLSADPIVGDGTK